MFPRLVSEVYNADALKSLYCTIFGIQNRLSVNTLDHPFFPKKGVSFFVEHRLNIATSERIEWQDTSKTGVSSSVLRVNNYHKVQANLKGLIPVNKKMSILVNSHLGITTVYKPSELSINDEEVKSPSYGEYPLFSDFYHIGGINQRARVNSIPFWGLKENDYQSSNFTALQLGIQYELIHNLFITPSVSSLYLVDYLDKDFLKKLPQMLFTSEEIETKTNYFESLYTYGINMAYRTPLGPVIINVSRESFSQRIRGYVSIGYSF
jgi:NTE family protein